MVKTQTSGQIPYLAPLANPGVVTVYNKLIGVAEWLHEPVGRSSTENQALIIKRAVKRKGPRITY